MLSPELLRDYVIAETLDYLEEGCEAAVNLLLGTAAQESRLGTEMGNGKLFGLYQISAATHRSVWDKFLIHHPETASRVRGLAGQHSFLSNPHNELVGNLKYATAIAWMVYKRRREMSLPHPEDTRALAACWHHHYPHHGHACNPQMFITRYFQLVRHLPVPVAA